MKTALTDADINMLLGTLNDPPLYQREIQGLDKALQTIRGELTNNLAKLTKLDDHIALERQKLEAGDIDEFSRRQIAERLRDLQVERSARLEAAAANREALCSQINQMRETNSRILHEDTTLAERLRTLFREQGVTLVSILTAIVMAISTLVLALTDGASGRSAVTPPPPPSDKGGLREWAKNSPSSWLCPHQTCWQGGCGPAGDHWEHCVLAPQHHGGGCRMARPRCVSSGSGCWRPALPGCPRAPSASWAKARLVPMWFRWRRGPFFGPRGRVPDPKGVVSARVDCLEGPVWP